MLDEQYYYDIPDGLKVQPKKPNNNLTLAEPVFWLGGRGAGGSWLPGVVTDGGARAGGGAALEMLGFHRS